MSKLPKYRRQKRHNQTDLAFVELAGVRHYLGEFGTKASKLLYDRLVSEWLADGRKPAPKSAEPESITVSELLAKWAKWAGDYYQQDGRSTGTLEAVRPALRTLRFLFGELPVDKFGPIALKMVREHIVTQGTIAKPPKGEKPSTPTGRPASRTYANSATNDIRAVFRWGVTEELVSPSTWHGLQAVEPLKLGRGNTRETDPIKPVADAVIDATIAQVGRIVGDMIRLQRLTGARPSEICNIKPENIDQSGEVWQYRPANHKTAHKSKSRTIFIGPKGQAILRPYLKRAANKYCFSPKEADESRRAELTAKRITPHGPGRNRPGSNRKEVPRRKPSNHYTTGSYHRAIMRGCDKAYPPPADLSETAQKKWVASHRWSPNQVRHSVGTWVRKQFGLEAAQLILGHAKADVTQVYAEKDIAKGLELAKQFG